MTLIFHYNTQEAKAGVWLVIMVNLTLAVFVVGCFNMLSQVQLYTSRGPV